MNWSVSKFGGTSLTRIPVVLERLAEAQRASPVAVVVSAIGDTTDWLLKAAQFAADGELHAANEQIQRVASLAREVSAPHLSPELLSTLTQAVAQLLQPVEGLLKGMALIRECTPHSRDAVLTVGELISAQVLTIHLQSAGIKAILVDARELLVTDENAGQANVLFADTKRHILKAASNWVDVIPVVTGFIGRSKSGRFTTLGRNGSDYTATVLAAALGAKQVTIWTDVPGVFTADPSLVPEAYPVKALTYFEALELAQFGTRMFHAHTMLPLIESNIALTIRSTREPHEPGTRIDSIGHVAEDQPTCVTSLENLSLLQVDSRSEMLPPGFFGLYLEELGRSGIRVWMANQTGLGVSASVVVSQHDLAPARALLEKRAPASDVFVGPTLENVTLITLVAERMGQQPNVAGNFFQALGNVGVKVLALAQGASQRSISCVVQASDTVTAVRSVHSAFNFAETELHLALLGHGTVGRELLLQIEQQTEVLREQHGIRLKLVGLFDSEHSVFSNAGLQPSVAARQLAEGSHHESIEALLPQLSRLPAPVLIDCTAAPHMESLYAQAFAQGINVVGANKKPLTTEFKVRQHLLAQARQYSRSYLYETTCGASLPIIETLKNLVRTGDTIYSIEGSLSGTLGFLCDALMKGLPFSKAVREAKAKGLTEPHPGDDLSGLDVARKALILARELPGSSPQSGLELAHISREPFIPAEALAITSIEKFMGSLETLDESFERRIETLRKQNKVLRYLARIEASPTGLRVNVGALGVDATHPAASLQGEEAFVAFTTHRYSTYPLVVRGAGAGGAVTAAGVLADVLRLAQNLKGRR
jgi:bifunctional aspartokinase / homoserine dehydrogenase 1